MILDEVHLSSSNRTAVIFGISNSDAESTAAFRKKAHFSLRDLFHLNQSTKSSIPLMGLS
jgi:peroxiredoxin